MNQSPRVESVQCPACGALLSVRAATDEDLIAMDPELAGIMGSVDHAEHFPEEKGIEPWQGVGELVMALAQLGGDCPSPSNVLPFTRNPGGAGDAERED